MKKGIVIAGIVAIMVMLVAVASAELKYYTVSNTNQYGDSVYSGEVSPSEVGNRRHYRVEFDSFERVIKSSTVVNSKVKATSEFLYPNVSSKFYTFYSGYNPDGDKRINTKIQRTPTGEKIRYDYDTFSGGVTSYVSVEYFQDRYEATFFTNDGKKTNKQIYYFDCEKNPEYASLGFRNLVYRSIWYPQGEDVYYENMIDLKTGETVVREKFNKKNDKYIKTMHEKNIYNTDGLLIRIDFYDPKTMKLDRANYYDDGLLVGKRFNYSSGDSQEIKYEYGKDRIETQSWLYFNNKLVCRFAYERKPNGTIIKTVAYDANDELMAEYPNQVVSSITKEGRPLGGGETKIYKKPPEWYRENDKD